MFLEVCINKCEKLVYAARRPFFQAKSIAPPTPKKVNMKIPRKNAFFRNCDPAGRVKSLLFALESNLHKYI